MESLVAVAEGDFVFDVEALVAEVQVNWPSCKFVRHTGERAETGHGQIQLFDEHGGDLLLVNILTGGDGLLLERSLETAAEFVAWLTGRGDFPDSGVVTTDWALDVMPLRPGMNAAELLAAYDQ